MPPDSPPHPIAAAPAVPPRACVLLVDGDAERARRFVAVLASASIEAEPVPDCAQAQVQLRDPSARYDAVVVHHRLPDATGLDLLDAVPIAARPCSVLVIDDRPHPDRSEQYRIRGAHRYVPPPRDRLQIIGRVHGTMLDTRAWRTAARRGLEPRREVPRVILDPRHAADRLRHTCGLSRIEHEVAYWVLLGLRDLDIARRLSKSERTAKRHVGKVLEKAGVKNRASLWAALYHDGCEEVAPDAHAVALDDSPTAPTMPSTSGASTSWPPPR